MKNVRRNCNDKPIKVYGVNEYDKKSEMDKRTKEL